jgi:probable F420-dependent oxidoreductase
MTAFGMRIGVVYPQTELGGDPDAVRRIADATEALGYDHLLAYDHVVGATHDREPKLWGPYTERHPFHDPFVLFGYVAGRCERIELVTGVLILPQRQTVLVAKQSADLDLLSGGRLRLGVGVGWNYVEYDALGQDFATRGPRADEQIGYLRRLWSEPLLTFEGRFDRIDRGNILPRPTRPIPIWVGGFGEPAFRRGGRLGDGFIFAGSVEHATEGMAGVRRHLAEAGRTDGGYGWELITLRAKTVDATVEAIEQWAAAGGTHATVCSMNLGLDGTDAHLDHIAAVAAKLGLSSARAEGAPTA